MTPEEFIIRDQEIKKAIAQYPDLEMGLAYKRWKEERGEKPTMLSTGDLSQTVASRTFRESGWKKCIKCGGKAFIESVCGGCVEGRKGYKSKYTCEDCLHRELSTQEYSEALLELINHGRVDNSQGSFPNRNPR